MELGGDLIGDDAQVGFGFGESFGGDFSDMTNKCSHVEVNEVSS